MNSFETNDQDPMPADVRVSAAELAALGDGEIAYIRPRQAADEQTEAAMPFLIFGARGDLLAEASSMEQGIGLITQNDLVPLYLN